MPSERVPLYGQVLGDFQGNSAVRSGDKLKMEATEAILEKVCRHTCRTYHDPESRWPSPPISVPQSPQWNEFHCREECRPQCAALHSQCDVGFSHPANAPTNERRHSEKSFDGGLFGCFLGLALCHWIDTRSKELTGFAVPLSGLRQRNIGILSQRHQLLFAVKPIGPAPELPAGRLDPR